MNSIIPAKESDWLNRANYTAEERRRTCGQLLSEAQYWDSAQYLKMMHDSTKRPYDTSTENQLRQSGIWFDRGRHSAFKEIAEKVKEMPWESDTKDSFLVWLKEQE